VERGLQTVVFTRSRQTAERYASQCADELQDRGEHELSRSVGAYQAALTDERRRDLEAELQSGELRGSGAPTRWNSVSTSAGWTP